MKRKLVELKNVYKIYPLGKTEVRALNGVSLSINQGEFTSLVGESGSGKTTILNMVGCIDYPTSGEVCINNKNTLTMDDNESSGFRNRTIGYIFQNFNLIPVLNVYENIEYPLLINNKRESRYKKKILDIIERVGLSSFIRHKPDTLSGGQRQRVAIARALITEPDLVIADEPTANLDRNTGNEILELMQNFNKHSGTTFIFSTHSDLIMQYAGRIITIMDGCVIDDKNKQETNKTV